MFHLIIYHLSPLHWWAMKLPQRGAVECPFSVWIHGRILGTKLLTFPYLLESRLIA